MQHLSLTEQCVSRAKYFKYIADGKLLEVDLNI
jgi:hypothetical protein